MSCDFMNIGVYDIRPDLFTSVRIDFNGHLSIAVNLIVSGTRPRNQDNLDLIDTGAAHGQRLLIDVM